MEKLSHWPAANRERLAKILRGDLKAGPVVFDFDFTLLGGDLTEQVFQLGLREGLITEAKIRQHAPGLLPQNTRDVWKHYLSLVEKRSYEEDAIHDHLWITRAFAGLKTGEMFELVVQSLAEHSDDRMPLLPSTVQLLGEFLQHNFDVYIVSGSGSYLVRQAVKDYVNPMLIHDHFPAMPLDKVIGLNQQVVEDRFTPNLVQPHSSYKGKVKCLDADPYFVISDSSTDRPLFDASEHKLWLQLIIDGVPAEDFREHCDESWLTQKVDVDSGFMLL